MANSSQLVLPAISAPAAFNFPTAVASYGERYPSRMREPQVVVNSSVQMLSFTATGIPYSTPVGRAAAICVLSDLRRSLGGVSSALRRLAFTRRSATALAGASLTRIDPASVRRRILP